MAYRRATIEHDSVVTRQSTRVHGQARRDRAPSARVPPHVAWRGSWATWHGTHMRMQRRTHVRQCSDIVMHRTHDSSSQRAACGARRLLRLANGNGQWGPILYTRDPPRLTFLASHALIALSGFPCVASPGYLRASPRVHLAIRCWPAAATAAGRACCQAADVSTCTDSPWGPCSGTGGHACCKRSRIASVSAAGHRAA